MKTQNLFDDIPEKLPEELFTTLLDAPDVRVERIVSWGQCSPQDFWYDQDRHEWLLLLEGSAAVHFEGDDEPVELRPGSVLKIPAHRRHRVVRTDADKRTIWLAVHYTSNAQHP